MRALRGFLFFRRFGTGEPSGLTPEELDASAQTLALMANELHADITLLRQRTEGAGQVAEYLVRRKCSEEEFSELRIAVVGNVDAGKR